jgi:glycosyltransferase involved in cell wall biosynthesis
VKVSIDIRELSTSEDRAGKYQYIYNLVSNLLSIDFNNDYSLLSFIKGFKGDENITSEIIYHFSGRLTRLFLERLFIPVDFLMGKIDVFHGPFYYIPVCRRARSVVTIHDLTAIKYPELLEPEWAVYFKKKIKASVEKADAVIAISNFTKEEIVESLHIDDEKIRVIYNGIAQRFKPVTNKIEIQEVTAKYGVSEPYLLFVGMIKPNKNIQTLIRAYIELRKSATYEYPLVIVGDKSWDFDEVMKVVHKFKAENGIIFTGVVSDEDLPYLYSGAELFVFPSLLEGFGIPVIEAMACGTPVVTSNRTSIPEITNGAAILVDPLDVNAIAEAMHSIVSDSELRGRLSEKGINQAKVFSWEKTARETLQLYHEIA